MLIQGEAIKRCHFWQILTSALNVNKHMLIHTRDKLCDCITFGKCLTQASHLRAHMRVPTGDFANMILVVNIFAQSLTLRTHMLVHTVEKQ